MRASTPRVPSKTGTGTRWRNQAACRDADPVLFFGPDGEKAVDVPRREGEATSFCKAYCPVIEECLEWALTVGETGVWGATTEAERKSIKRRRARVEARAKSAAAVA